LSNRRYSRLKISKTVSRNCASGFPAIGDRLRAPNLIKMDSDRRVSILR
jgi:hypothetical protein